MNGHHEDHVLYLPSQDPEQEFRLHLDENISGSVARLLRSRGYDVTTTNDVGLRAHSDTSHMHYAAQQRRIIVTRDRDFLKLDAEDHEHSGIVYWPHSERKSLHDMQELLVHLLQRVAESPSQGTEVATNAQALLKRKRNRKRSRKGPKQSPPISHKLPGGLRVHATVVAVRRDGLEVRLATGQKGRILRQRLSRVVPKVDSEIEAVTVRFVKARKQLHLSLRRAFSWARTMPTIGLKQLRSNNCALMRHICGQWPVELEVEGQHTVRLYGETAAAVSTAAQFLDRKIPWTASAVIQLDKHALRSWAHATFGGGVGKLSEATGTRVQYHHPHSLIVCAPSNRLLDSVLRMIKLHVPDLNVIDFQAARSEALMPCRWQDLNELLPLLNHNICLAHSRHLNSDTMAHQNAPEAAEPANTAVPTNTTQRS